MTEGREIEDLMSAMDEGALDAVVKAGLSSSPPHLADPLLLLGAGMSPWALYGSLMDREIELTTPGLSCVGSADEIVYLECVSRARNHTLKDTGDATVRCFSIDANELNELQLKSDHRYRGELRDAFRWLKLNPGKRRLLVWNGFPMHRYTKQAFPYFLRYIGQVMGPEDRLLLCGFPDEGDYIQTAFDMERVDPSVRKLVFSATGNKGGEVRFKSEDERVSLVYCGDGPWVDRGFEGVVLMTLETVSLAQVDESIAFSGLSSTWMGSDGGGGAWLIRKEG